MFFLLVLRCAASCPKPDACQSYKHSPPQSPVRDFILVLLSPLARSRRLESRYQTIRLRVRRNEIFMALDSVLLQLADFAQLSLRLANTQDSYHQLRIRTGEEMRAKIQAVCRL